MKLILKITKNKKEGYVEKYKDKEQRKSAWAHKQKYKVADYKKFKNDGVGLGFDFLDPVRTKETKEQKVIFKLYLK